MVTIKTKSSLSLFIVCFILFFSHTIFATDDNYSYNKDISTIHTKIYSYLIKYSKDKEFTEKFNSDSDKDKAKAKAKAKAGITLLWAYSKWLKNQTDPKTILKEDYHWLKSEIDPLVVWKGKGKYEKTDFNYETQNLFELTIDTIINWDEERELNDQEKEIFENFITLADFFEDSLEHIQIASVDFDEILEHTNGRSLNREYSIASLFTLEELKELLNTEHLIQEERAVLIISHKGGTILFKKENLYFHLDENNIEEIATTSLDEVAEFVFKTNKLDEGKPSPIGILIFSTEEIPKAAYPPQKEILGTIFPSLTTSKDYANGMDGLMIAAAIGCLESTKYFLGKNVDPNTQDNDGYIALIYALFSKRDDIIDILIENNLIENYKVNDESSLFDLALDLDNIKIVKAISYGKYFNISTIRSQDLILAKIVHYLLDNSNDKNFIKKFQRGKGFCGGIASWWLIFKGIPEHKTKNLYLWLKHTIDSMVKWQGKGEYSKEPYHNTKLEIDYNWFNSTINSFASWDGEKDLENKEKEDFEDFISLIEILHNISNYLPIYKTDQDKAFAILDGEKLIKEYSIASLFTLEQLKELLNTKNIIQNKKMVLIFSHNHATALFKDEENYLYFDPNNTTGEIKTTSPNKIAEMIFDASKFIDSYPSPLSFHIFSFDDKDSPSYPSPQSVLAKINPSLETQKNYANESSSLITASRNSLESVQYFLEQKANPNIQDNQGMSALMWATTKGYFHIVKEILEKGINVDPNLQNKYRGTALMIGAMKGHLNIVKEILEKGINVDLHIKDKNGKDAITHAKENGHIEITELIEEKIADHHKRRSAFDPFGICPLAQQINLTRTSP